MGKSSEELRFTNYELKSKIVNLKSKIVNPIMTEQTRTDIVLKGIGVSPGINIGRAYLVDGGSLETPAYCYLDITYIS